MSLGTINMSIVRFLKGNKFLPISEPNWNCFQLAFGQTFQKSQTYKQIKNEVGSANGLYAIEHRGVRFYLGKGNPLSSRIQSHYREAYEQIKGDRTGDYHVAFSSLIGDSVKVYWQALEDERVRTIVELMLEYHMPRTTLDTIRECRHALHT